MAQPKHKAIVVAVPFDTWQRLAWLADACELPLDDMLERMLVDFANPPLIAETKPIAEVAASPAVEIVIPREAPRLQLPKLPPEISDTATDRQAETAARLFRVSKFDTASIARLLNLTEPAVVRALRGGV